MILNAKMSSNEISKYIEIIKTNVDNSSMLTKYLLFTQISQYMGMSLPTSVVLFFGGMYLTQENEYKSEKSEKIEKIEKIEKSEESEESEETQENKTSFWPFY